MVARFVIDSKILSVKQTSGETYRPNRLYTIRWGESYLALLVTRGMTAEYNVDTPTRP